MTDSKSSDLDVPNKDQDDFLERVIKHHHVDSRFYKHSTIVSIVVSTLVAALALLMGVTNHMEDVNRQIAQDTFQGKIWCQEGADRLRTMLASKQSLYNKMRFISDIKGMRKNCDQVGQPLPLDEVLSVLDKLALDSDEEVAKSASRTARYLTRKGQVNSDASKVAGNVGIRSSISARSEVRLMPMAGVPIESSREDPNMPKVCRRITVDSAINRGETAPQIWCLKGDSWVPYTMSE